MEEEKATIDQARGPHIEFWVILALIFLFLTALPAIFTYPAERILFNPQVYKQALDAENPYDRLPQLIGQTLVQGGSRMIPGTGGTAPSTGSSDSGATTPPGQPLPALSASAYDRVVRAVFTPEWVKSQAYALIDQFWAYFNFQSPDFHLYVDFRPVKDHLNGPDSPKIVSLIMEGLQPCTADEIFNYTLQALQGTAGDLPLCRPPDALLGAGNLLVGGLLRGTAAALPDRLDLASPLNLTVRLAPGAQAQGARLFAAYHVYRQINYAFPWTALTLLVITGLLAYRTWRGPFYWLGVGLLLPGLAGLVIALLTGIFMSQIAPFLVVRFFGANFALFDLLVGVLARVSGQFVIAAALTALAAAVMGLALVWWGVRGKRRGTVGQ